jgi:hypothetical protein
MTNASIPTKWIDKHVWIIEEKMRNGRWRAQRLGVHLTKCDAESVMNLHGAQTNYLFRATKYVRAKS